jgi:hypothetical protein
MTVIPALKRLKQDSLGFKASLDYMEIPRSA